MLSRINYLEVVVLSREILKRQDMEKHNERDFKSGAGA
jgi:hypothetical protein